MEEKRSGNDFQEINLGGMKREEVRNLIKNLPRNKSFVIDFLSDGRRVFVRTDGDKTSLEDGIPLDKKIDITVHYDNEPKRKISYINDIIVPLIQIEILFRNLEMDFSIVINAIKDSIELVSLKEIFKKHSQLFEFDKTNPTGYLIEFLLALIKALSLQEDINYWGINPKTNEPYEGRYKPYNAIVDIFLKNIPLTHVIRKHRLF